MKHTLALVLMVFGIVGCAVEEDTRLVCDCVKSTFTNGEQVWAKCMDVDGSNEGSYSNKSLVFNESKKLFMFNGTQMGDMFTSFDDNVISYSFEGDIHRTSRTFDRVSLTMVEALQDRDYNFENKVWSLYRTYHYQCKVVEGV
ncbi:hypothetical protein N8349_03620 [Gammaproteobacteria bacterium]|nr:hypothetical protein [Gammaproteobacteria bacterium]